MLSAIADEVNVLDHAERYQLAALVFEFVCCARTREIVKTPDKDRYVRKRDWKQEGTQGQIH